MRKDTGGAERRKEAACASNLSDTFTLESIWTQRGTRATRKILSRTKHRSSKTTGQR